MSDWASFVAEPRSSLIADALRTFGRVTIRVNGSSMLPSIWPGDVLTIEQCGMADVRPADIVLFSRHDRLFAHRLIAHHGDTIVTQGDGIPTPDPAVTAEEILGVAIAATRDGVRVNLNPPRGVGRLAIRALVRRSSSAAKLLQRGRSVYRQFLTPAESAL